MHNSIFCICKSQWNTIKAFELLSDGMTDKGMDKQATKQTRIVISRQSPQFLGLCKKSLGVGEIDECLKLQKFMELWFGNCISGL